MQRRRWRSRTRCRSRTSRTTPSLPSCCRQRRRGSATPMPAPPSALILSHLIHTSVPGRVVFLALMMPVALPGERDTDARPSECVLVEHSHLTASPSVHLGTSVHLGICSRVCCRPRCRGSATPTPAPPSAHRGRQFGTVWVEQTCSNGACCNCACIVTSMWRRLLRYTAPAPTVSARTRAGA